MMRTVAGFVVGNQSTTSDVGPCPWWQPQWLCDLLNEPPPPTPPSDPEVEFGDAEIADDNPVCQLVMSPRCFPRRGCDVLIEVVCF